MAYLDNPFIGQTIEVGGTTKQWNGYAWVNITNGNKELRLRFAEKSAAHMTLAEVQVDGTLIVGPSELGSSAEIVLNVSYPIKL